uniref:laminin-like protein epi-1 n=1 Tax=Myxine glutinosa TaxID=7769 RepID=UPI00358F3273
MKNRIWICLGVLWSVTTVLPRKPRSCEHSSCYPATGDLLQGRAKQLTATSTCGLFGVEKYCTMGDLNTVQKCFECDSRNSTDSSQKNHRVQNIILDFHQNYRDNWWQSQNGVEKVTLQLDLEAEFLFTHLILTFKTFRPAAMYIERSSDFGQTWRPYRYFAQHCAKAFPRVPLWPPRQITNVVCDQRYSDMEPSTGGEVIYKVLEPSIKIKDPYSKEIQDLLHVTNLRVVFMKLHTMGDNKLNIGPEARWKYHYALYSAVLRGSCFCYGHAQICTPASISLGHAKNMVNGNCACKHNTDGKNCEQCKDFHHDTPWRLAKGPQTNACKRCECNGHSERCNFDHAVYMYSGNVSGGVCSDCQHNTAGQHCDTCRPMYYLQPGHSIRDPHACQPCNCNPLGTLHEGACDPITDPSTGAVAGTCHCKPRVQGPRCEQCLPGHHRVRRDDPSSCRQFKHRSAKKDYVRNAILFIQIINGGEVTRHKEKIKMAREIQPHCGKKMKTKGSKSPNIFVARENEQLNRSPTIPGKSGQLNRSPTIPGESGQLNRSLTIPGEKVPTILEENEQLNRSLTILGENEQLNRSPTIPGKSGQLNRSPTIPGESGQLNRSLTIPGENEQLNRRESGQLNRSPTIRGENEQLNRSPTVLGENEQLNRSPTIRGENEQLNRSPTVLGENVQLNRSPTILGESGQLNRSPTIRGESGQLNRSLTILGEKKQLNRSPSIRGESGQLNRRLTILGENEQLNRKVPTILEENEQLNRSLTILGENEQLNRSPTIPGKSGQLNRSPTIPGESGQLNRSLTIPGENEQLNRRESGQLNRSPTIRGENEQLNRIPTVLGENVQLNRSPTILGESGQLNRSPTIRGESGQLNRSLTILGEKKQLNRSPSIRGESGQLNRRLTIRGENEQLNRKVPTILEENEQLNRSLTILGENEQLNRSPTIPGKSGQLNRSPTIPGESGQLNRSLTIPGENEQLNRRESGQLNRSPTIRGENEQLNRSPTVLGENEQLNRSPTIRGENEQLNRSPTVLGENVQLNRSPTILGESGQLNRSPTIRGESGQLNRSLTILGEKKQLNRSPSIRGESGQLNRRLTILGENEQLNRRENEQLNRSPTIRGENEQLNRSPTIRGESGQLNRSATIQGESRQLNRRENEQLNRSSHRTRRERTIEQKSNSTGREQKSSRNASMLRENELWGSTECRSSFIPVLLVVFFVQYFVPNDILFCLIIGLGKVQPKANEVASSVLALAAAQPIASPACQCDPLGTVPGQVSCTRDTGACICKRYAMGRDCGQCLPGFWGLNTDKDGCRPCECDFGGAYNNRCSQQSGQCSCRSNLIGRTCDQVPLGHFCMPLDMYTYEAEEARFIDLQSIQKHPNKNDTRKQCDSPQPQIQPRGPRPMKNDTREQCESPQPQIQPRGPRPMIVSIVQRKQRLDQERTWTGPGFARVRDGAGLEFTINDIPASAQYELVIRYEPEQLLENWEVLVRVFSRSQPSESHCANTLPTDELQTATLHSDRRYAVLPVTVCLESGITYMVDINLQLVDPHNRHPSAHILIDSLVLFPQPASLSGSHPTSTPWEDFKRYRCAEAFREVHHGDLTQVCQQLVCSTSAILHNGAIPCDCHLEGSLDTICDRIGGQCRCKANVIGRRCDTCISAATDLLDCVSSTCDCDPRGSLSRHCDPATSSCQCLPRVAGPYCKSCLADHFGFPSCEPCRCPRNLRGCDPITGACLECLSYTEGERCERCIAGYYGDPAVGCEPCLCPGRPNSGHYHATSCYQDPVTRRITCNCHKGYEGAQCNVCAPGYSGNPMYPGRKCVQCNCNGNTKPMDQAPCDPNTGNCLRCLYHTTGPRCERCEDGYYGDATRQDCRPCDCDIQGALSPPCDPMSGHCHCRTGVTGPSCKACLKDHFAFPRCEPCRCYGNQADCDPITGACRECGENTEGELCERCLLGFYGDPTVGCRPCPCPGTSDSGRYHGISCSEDPSTRKITCNCHIGYAGAQCNVCAPGYSGNPMYPGRKCVKCNCNGNTNPMDQAPCDPNTGNCLRCLYHTTGPQCERCEDGYYGDATRQDCRPCDCDIQGALSPPCDPMSGHCHCRTGVAGPSCKACLKDHFAFPRCEPCRCYGSQADCDPITGACRECPENAEGELCDRCIEGFYGDPATSCRPCQCPGTPDSGNYHATSCSQDAVTRQITCNCRNGYSGAQCNVCAPGYSGNPTYLGGKCVQCNCNGNTNPMDQAPCDPNTGNCLRCLYHTTGPQCERCEDGYYGDATRQDCRPCDCDIQGALSPPCDPMSGHCHCRTGVAGPSCKACLKDHFAFPRCEPCRCYGSQADCDPITGACRECGENTEGELCERCLLGFYGDPTVGCRPCPCPGTSDSGRYHGISCSEDPSTRKITCNCHIGYAGAQCNVCAPGYSGNPMYPGRKCVKCNCNGNTNPMDQAPCDPNTGNCLRCLYHTTGPQCERCEDGYYGDATRQDCRPCDCDIQGALIPPCDPMSGHCHCRTGVAGPSCKACLKDHFAFPRCEPCRCYGSQADCDPITGACRECPENAEGELCDRCIEGFYGDPATSCRPCQCPGTPDSGNYHATSCSQDAVTRQITCNCRNGYSGAQCNVCAPGYSGNPTYLGGKCVQCNCNGNTNPMDQAPCDPNTGNCLRCLYHTTGPQCERCEDGYYGDATRQDCRPCDCDIQGALSPPCDPMSGHCHCRTGVAGPSCKACLKDHFAFPRCEPCRCYGSQADCDPITGACRECPENAEGELCDRCIEGFYGDPATSCRPCQCPGTPDSGNYHATSCSQDAVTRQITCNCRNGYSGAQCNVCAPGYSGNPTYLGGKCVQCNCNGNTNPMDQATCDPNTGNCLRCLYHTTGPRCERCEDGYYGDATKQKCLSCDCNPEGALSPPCDPVTGECRCRPRVAGTSCKACLPDHFGFPTCRQCSCHRNSAGCNPITGACLECLGNTEGERCERCVPGYYGDPKVGCQPCPCPGGPNSGRYHATSCSQNPVTRQITCNCTKGYAGSQCSTCAQGYSGNPMYPGRKCVPCDCNGNSDPSDAAACNGLTGSCQHCLHNTAGPQCERCEDGYYGDAKRQDCQACNCHDKGTEPSTCEADKPCSCDADSGKCRCLQGVVGQHCDSCAPNHWGLSSGKGCQPCDCHPERSLDKSCDEDTGQCQCKQKFGGKTCSDCQLDHWGTPNTCCTPCDCDHKGILSPPCEKATGRCRCKDGVTGKRCDTCARGYWGIFPNCQPCHSCFLRWDAEVADVVKDTEKLKLQADSMVKNGVRGAYEKHFSVLEENLGDIQRILEWQDGHEAEITRLQRRHNQLRDNMNQLGEDLEKQEKKITDRKGDIDDTELQLDELERNSRNLNATARSIMRQLMLLLNSDYRNAFTSIRRASEESQSLEDQAKIMVSGPGGVVSLSKGIRERVKDLMEGTNGVQESLNKMQSKLDVFRKEAEKLDLKSINEKLCGSPTAERCEDSRCGGAGCRDSQGKMACGGPGCSGATTLASDAFKMADDTAGLLRNAQSQLQDLGNKVESIQRTSNAVKEKAQRALDKAQHTKDSTNSTAQDMKKLLQRIKDFLKDEGADSDSIAIVANKVLAIALPASSADINRLTNDIRAKIDNLKDIEAVITSNTKNIQLAEKLLEDAQKAGSRATDVHGRSVLTQDALNKAQEAQDSAREAINRANDKLNNIQRSLVENTKQLSAVDPLVHDLTDQLTTLTGDITYLQNLMKSNENTARHAENMAHTAKQIADRAKTELGAVRTRFMKLQDMASSGSGPVAEEAMKRATNLQDEAQKLVDDTIEKLKRLEVLEKTIKENDGKLQKAQGDLTELEQKANGLLDVINANVTQYVNCQS